MPTSYSERVLAAIYDNKPAPVGLSATTKRTLIVVVASPRAQSGKTFLAHLVIDYLRLGGGEVEAFDLNPGDHALAAYRPAVTARSDLATTQAQIALFDRLIDNNGIAKVVDVGYPSYERFFALCEEIRFIDEARKRAFDVIILFPAEAHQAASTAYKQLLRRFPRTFVVPVLNEAILKGQKVREHYPYARTTVLPLQIPLLPRALKTYAERPDCTFTDFHAQSPMAVPIAHAFELHSWTKRAFLEFRELELRMLMEKLQASLNEWG